MELTTFLRTVPDFPKPGINFIDVTPLIGNAGAFSAALDDLAQFAAQCGPLDAIAAPEARGFVIGAALAARLGLGFVLVRKPGKLPADTASRAYELEYGQATLEVHRDAVRPGQRVLVVDDLLATGGTARATIDLMESLGAQVVGVGFLVELAFLSGRAQLANRALHATIVL